MSADMTNNEHISFEILSEYVFYDDKDLLELFDYAKINQHLMQCESCMKKYNALVSLREAAYQYSELKPAEFRIMIRLFEFLYSKSQSKRIQDIVKECLSFKKWLTFSIKSIKELVQIQSPGFSYPRLATSMKSSPSDRSGSTSSNEIRSTLCDGNMNRVSVGLDGTLSIQLNALEYPVGKKVIIVSDDAEQAPQMMELTRYNDLLNNVRFEGLKPGDEYSVFYEE